MLRLILTATLVMFTPLALAVELPKAVKACVNKNSQATSSVQTIELRSKDRRGYEQVLRANSYVKRSPGGKARIMMHFNEPFDMRGARFLIIEKSPRNDMYIYMPGLLVVRKITSKRISSSILGTDFSYEDYERLHGILSNLRSEQAADAKIGKRPVHVINSYPKAGSGYKKITTYIDTKTCVALKTELFGKNNKLRKLLTVNARDVHRHGKIYLPHKLLMRDLRDKTETRMIVEKIKIDMPLEDKLFDPKQLKKVKLPAMQAD